MTNRKSRKFNKNIDSKRYKEGFGLLEVLLSGVIIITILSAVVFVGRAAMNSSVNTQQRAQATYLAQLNLELARQIRDTNWLQTINDSTGNPQTDWQKLSVTNTSPYTFSTLFNTNPSYLYYDTTLKRFFVTNSNSVSTNLFSQVTLDNKTFYLSLLKVGFNDGSFIPNISSSNGLTVSASDDNSLQIKTQVSNSSSLTSDNKSFTSPIVDEKMLLTNWKPNY